MTAAAPDLDEPDHLGWTQGRVRAQVEAQFGVDHRAAVLRELARYEGHSVSGRARVQLAILQRAQGDVSKLGRLVQYALARFEAFPVRPRGRRDRDVD